MISYSPRVESVCSVSTFQQDYWLFGQAVCENDTGTEKQPTGLQVQRQARGWESLPVSSPEMVFCSKWKQGIKRD